MKRPQATAADLTTLKIALVLETSGGGSGRHALDLAEGLASRGQDVTVIWSPVRAEAAFAARLNGLHGVEAHALDMYRSVSMRDFASLRALTRRLRAVGPFHVIHGHSSKAGALIRLLPRTIPGRRIYTPHAFRTMDPTMGGAARTVYGTIERLLAARADRIVTVGEVEREHALSLGIRPDRLTTVVNGCAPAPGQTREGARRAMQLAPGDLAVGFIGRLDRQKDPLRFVDAVTQAAREEPQIRGVVIGDGPLRREAEERCDQGSVRFLGWQDGPALFPGLDVFSLTSHYEAMPYTLLEALHAGVPAVVTDVGGVAETVLDGHNGHVLAVHAPPSEIADHLVALARDRARREAFSKAALRMAQSRTVDRMVADTLAVYSDGLTPQP